MTHCSTIRRRPAGVLVSLLLLVVLLLTSSVHGAAALGECPYPPSGPDQVESLVEGRAVDTGTAGVDTRYGYDRLYVSDPSLTGRIYLPIVHRNPSPTPGPTPTRTPTGTPAPGCQTRLYLSWEGQDQVLSPTPVSAGYGTTYASTGNSWEWPITLTGDLAGNRYGFSLMLASLPSGATLHWEIIWRHNQEDTVLASTDFAVTYKAVYERFTQNMDGPDPSTSAGDVLMLRMSNNGSGSGSVRYGPPPIDSYILVPCY